MTNTLTPVLKQKFFDNNGAPLAFGLLGSFAAGTNTPLATFNASGATNANPVVLNIRGEADVWIPPNIAYKFTLTDSLGNTIPGFPIDNVVNSQLVTLYGGVDTGSVNAYLLNFTANFTALQDGIVIYWIPSNTNTAASTLNVNGLGVVNILNQNGIGLLANQLVANQVATVMYRAGSWLLLASGVAASVSSGTFAPVWSGFLVAPTGNMAWLVIGGEVVLQWQGGQGTSNANFMGIGNLPINLRPTTRSLLGMAPSIVFDNGAFQQGSVGHGVLGTMQWNMGSPLSANGFTPSGSKGLATGWTWAYPLT